MARRSRRSRHLGAMQSDQTANILIGVGAVLGIGTLAYYFMRKPDETTSETESSTYTEPGSSAATQSAYTQPGSSAAAAEQRQIETQKNIQAAIDRGVPVYKAARDAYVAEKATYTRSLYE